MLTSLHITNYRSFADTRVELKPFTVLVGANGSGKSNLLKLLLSLSSPTPIYLDRHLRNRSGDTTVEIGSTNEKAPCIVRKGHFLTPRPREVDNVRVFSIDPNAIGRNEPLVSNPDVKSDGSGAIQVLDALKTGDREDIFDTIERLLCDFVPEIEKLSFRPGQQVKSLQVREADIPVPVPLSELSEGTRLVLTILTIVHQERPPSIICIEDIDRASTPPCLARSSNYAAPWYAARMHRRSSPPRTIHIWSTSSLTTREVSSSSRRRTVIRPSPRFRRSSKAWRMPPTTPLDRFGIRASWGADPSLR